MEQTYTNIPKKHILVALVENKPVTLVNYPEAPHSYELSLDGPETRRILQQGLDFLLAHLR